ncbi:MAG: ComF family protein [Gemmatales bacterium]|nr:ComF family protein [Gemmatales bacterium]
MESLLNWGRRLWRECWEGVWELVFPPRCWLCQQLTEAEWGLCQSCQGQLREQAERACWRCGRGVGPFADVHGGCNRCREESLPFHTVKRLGKYEGALREAILLIKHSWYEGLSVALGRFLGHLLAQTETRFEAIVPVPLHWWRFWQRGYNQAQALAEGIAEVVNKPVLPAALIRVRPTPSQAGKSATQRRENVRGAFRSRLRAPALPASLLLVDDVMTTGSTLIEAAKTLRQAGAKEVHVAVLATTD